MEIQIGKGDGIENRTTDLHSETSKKVRHCNHSARDDATRTMQLKEINPLTPPTASHTHTLTRLRSLVSVVNHTPPITPRAPPPPPSPHPSILKVDMVAKSVECCLASRVEGWVFEFRPGQSNDFIYTCIFIPSLTLGISRIGQGLVGSKKESLFYLKPPLEYIVTLATTNQLPNQALSIHRTRQGPVSSVSG